MLDQLQNMYFSSNNDMGLDNYSQQKYMYIIIHLILDHISVCLLHHIWASSRENLSSGFPKKKTRLNPVSSATETSLKIELSFVASLDMVLSKKRITKVLIRLRGCAGWSAPLLFANLRRQVFCEEAHISHVT